MRFGNSGNYFGLTLNLWDGMGELQLRNIAGKRLWALVSSGLRRERFLTDAGRLPIG
jgi:hypothetical protein